jgi:hypothetical protein
MKLSLTVLSLATLSVNAFVIPTGKISSSRAIFSTPEETTAASEAVFMPLDETNEDASFDKVEGLGRGASKVCS